MPLLPGERLHARYRIVTLVVEGGRGAVYRAWDEQAEADRAIRELALEGEEMVRQFRNAAARLGALSHPGLPALRDHFVDGDHAFLIHDYVDGVSLQTMLDRYASLPPDRVSGWLAALEAPLHYLHDQGRFHGDIKPANLRLTPAGDLFLVDGLLSDLNLASGDGRYTAPEEEVSPAADIYSLGATLYALLTGNPPPDALKRASGLADLIPAREVNSAVPPHLSVVASRALALRPDARYENVADFVRALAPPADQTDLYNGTSAPRRSARRRPLAPVPRFTPQRRRQLEMRTIYALLGLLALIIAGGLALASLDDLTLRGISEEEATATFASQVIAAATALAPTPSLTPPPTETPVPTPAPILHPSGARMLYMPGGVFRMGNDDGERDERPSRIVRLDPYFIDETEVSNSQYAQCVSAGVCRPPFSSEASYHPGYYGDPAFDDYPVIFVSWFAAETFCEWRDARLPSEAEWERAASFDPVNLKKLAYPWGDAFDGRLLNFCDVNCPHERRDTEWDDGHRDTAPVTAFPEGRSTIGTYNMLGNVLEWTADWYDPRYYETMPDVNPLGPVEGGFKVVRGGSWISSVDAAAVTARGSFDPTVSRAVLGFRCALTPP